MQNRMNIEEKEVKKSKVEMSTLDCYMDTFNKFFTFKGRASKYEYWSFAFVNCIVSIVLSILDFIPTLGYVSSLYIFIITIPSTTLSVGRFHDVGKFGWILVYLYFY